ncbi:hypothetical protein [Nocardia nepalensis]|uniref:hypothetical protein n=1 Tax=Nocardia nepalensis TaxID=3375448 RepID=UPI003B6814CF
MTWPSRPWEVLAPWQTRLLEQVQNLSVDHERVLHRGYPTYNLAHGNDEVQMTRWRAYLRELDAERGEVEIRALASGVPKPLIDHAHELGDRGIRWNERQPPPPEPSRGGEAVRERMIEDIAADVWQLEHMAAVTAARRERRIAQGIHSEDHPVAASQLQTNMTALWVRAADTSHAADLTDIERAQLWGRDAQGWRTLVEATVNTYADPALEQRWRAQAWPGIEHDAQRNMQPLGSGEPDRPVDAQQLPPLPQLMIHHASQALRSGGAESAELADVGGGAAIGVAFPDGVIRSWGAEPVGDAEFPAPGPASGLEPET